MLAIRLYPAFDFSLFVVSRMLNIDHRAACRFASLILVTLDAMLSPFSLINNSLILLFAYSSSTSSKLNISGCRSAAEGNDFGKCAFVLRVAAIMAFHLWHVVLLMFVHIVLYSIAGVTTLLKM